MKNRPVRKGIIIAIVLILVFAGFSVFNYIRFKSQKKAVVEVEEKIPVQVTDSKVIFLQKVLEQIGEIIPMIEVDVFPKVPGKIIQRLLVERGDYAEKGDLIASLEDSTIKAKIEEAEAAHESSKASLRQVETRLAVLEQDRLRLENLYKENAVAKQRLDHIEAEHEAAEAGRKLALARIKSAEAVLKQLQVVYRDHKIYAPASGYISARYVDEGAMSGSGQPIVRISSEDKLKLVTTVTEKDFPDIKKGMEVEIRVDAFPEKVFKGKISVINPTIDPATRTGEIEIHIRNKDLILRSGMFAHINLFMEDKSAIVVPADAINRVPGTGNYFVYVVENNKAVLKNIVIGLSQENFVEVTHGLKSGEQVVVRGQNRLKDGTAVVIEEKGVIN